MTNKSRSSWGSRIWKRCSPLQLLRSMRDSYVTGCISAADSAPLNAVAKHAGIFHASDQVDALSRPSSRRDDVEPYSIEALSRQSSRNEATQQWRRQQQQKPITLNLLIADQVQFLRHNFFPISGSSASDTQDNRIPISLFPWFWRSCSASKVFVLGFPQKNELRDSAGVRSIQEWRRRTRLDDLAGSPPNNFDCAAVPHWVPY